MSIKKLCERSVVDHSTSAQNFDGP
jgi:hypothetical protein